MKGPSPARWLPGVALALGLSVGAAGCVENDQSIVITGNYALDSSCLPPASGGIALGRGRFDVGVASSLNRGYFMVPRVQNQLPSSIGMTTSSGATVPGMTPVEANNVQLVGFEVDLIPDPGQPISSQLPAGVPGLTSLALPYYGGLVEHGGGTFTGSVEVFNSNAASMLLASRAVSGGPSTVGSPYQTVTARLRAKVLRSGGVIFSNWIEFPIEVCAFCLASKPGEAGVSGFNAGTGSLYECPDATTLTDDMVTTTTCLPQQDAVTPCCLKDRQVLCGLQIPHKKATM